jgi:hypothetical protein
MTGRRPKRVGQRTEGSALPETAPDAHIVPKRPIISAARTVLPPSNCSISFGSTGMIMPSASMSRSTVMKMNATAARLGGVGGEVDSVIRAPGVPSHAVRR